MEYPVWSIEYKSKDQEGCMCIVPRQHGKHVNIRTGGIQPKFDIIVWSGHKPLMETSNYQARFALYVVSDIASRGGGGDTSSMGNVFPPLAP